MTLKRQKRTCERSRTGPAVAKVFRMASRYERYIHPSPTPSGEAFAVCELAADGRYWWNVAGVPVTGTPAECPNLYDTREQALVAARRLFKHAAAASWRRLNGLPARLPGLGLAKAPVGP
jgi:hypothetical protein